MQKYFKKTFESERGLCPVDELLQINPYSYYNKTAGSLAHFYLRCVTTGIDACTQTPSLLNGKRTVLIAPTEKVNTDYTGEGKALIVRTWGL